MAISSKKNVRKVALIGNPNSGKTSVFNHLTGLDQKVGNYPGVTVEKRIGRCSTPNGQDIDIIDLPGTYSLYPASRDEEIVLELINTDKEEDRPDLICVVVDANNVNRGLFLYSQVADLGYPTLLVLSMIDVLERRGTLIDVSPIEAQYKNPILLVNARQKASCLPILDAFDNIIENPVKAAGSVFDKLKHLPKELISKVEAESPRFTSDYAWWQNYIYVNKQKPNVDHEVLNTIKKVRQNENNDRHKIIKEICGELFFPLNKKEERASRTEWLDDVLTHPIYGYGFFLLILFVIFQAIFAWASVPMDMIDLLFSNFSEVIQSNMPANAFTDLITQGIIPGIGGVVIFVPQIAILFFFIAILEESGYMSRVVYLMDRIMRMFGLHGKSIVPLISGVACAIPAVMAARSIENWRDRLATIFVTPFMTCSARLPVYTILIAIAIPNERVLGFLNLQAVVMMALYILGFLAALITALIMKQFTSKYESNSFIMEMPDYKQPRWKNIGLTIWNRSKAFVFEAGKIIFAISILLWILSSYGPDNSYETAVNELSTQTSFAQADEEIQQDMISSWQLENSYAGIVGKFIEPAIKPLGYDWKIGIALVTSFAAREIFVGTMATIYSVGHAADDEATIKERMRQQKNPDTGLPMFNLATSLSLLIFYAFAMQCMSTMAIVKRETNSWFWPFAQALYMTFLAYVGALITYNIFS